MQMTLEYIKFERSVLLFTNFVVFTFQKLRKKLEISEELV